jgi:polyisoprenoid-binding protein YceI
MKHLIVYTSFLLLTISLFSCNTENTEKNATSLLSAKDPVTANISSNSNAAAPWAIDAAASKVTFTIKNLGINVEGSFGGLTGNVFFDAKNIENSSVEGSVEVTTINTGIKKRDKDLMGEKFFDAEKNKRIIFKSNSIMRVGNSYKAVGSLTIKGKSKQLEIPFTFEQNGNNGLFKSNFTVNRRDFNVGGNEVVMADELTVSLSIAVKKK